MATEQQIPKLAGSIVEHQSGFAALSTEDAQWVIAETKQAVALFCEAVRSRAKAATNTLLEKVFRIIRGGKRTTEQVVSATMHTFINSNITSANFPLTEAPEEERELVAFQVPECDHGLSSEEILAELKKRCLERPTYEDGLKFDEAYPYEKGVFVFVFLYGPWRVPGPDHNPHVLVVDRGIASHRLDLGCFGHPWGRHCWFVGVLPRK